MSTETQRKRIEQSYTVVVDRGPKRIFNLSLIDKSSGELVAVFYGRGEEIPTNLAYSFVAAKSVHDQLRVATATNRDLEDQIAARDAKLAEQPPVDPEAIQPDPELPDDDPEISMPDPEPSAPAPDGVKVSLPARKMIEKLDATAADIINAYDIKGKLTLHDVQRYETDRAAAKAAFDPTPA